MIDAPKARVLQVELCPCINVSFLLSGTQLPADYGLRNSAISRATQRGSSRPCAQLAARMMALFDDADKTDSFGESLMSHRGELTERMLHLPLLLAERPYFASRNWR